VKKAWRAIHFTLRILKKGNSSIKSFAYVSLVRPILEFGPRAGIRTGRDKKYVRQGGKKRPYLQIIRTFRTGNLWRRVESCHAYVLSSKHTLENGRGRL